MKSDNEKHLNVMFYCLNYNRCLNFYNANTLFLFLGYYEITMLNISCSSKNEIMDRKKQKIHHSDMQFWHYRHDVFKKKLHLIILN